jgi:hypothetical protein
MPQYDQLPPQKIINLFVPEGVRGYDKMVEISKGKLDGDYYYERERTCHDGEVRSGIWVPYSWWISRPEK